MRRYDVAVAGLGAMGSAATYELARRGRRVLGLDRFHPPHALGSTHGRTRIIRESYFEHPLYVPLVRRAYDLWEDLERASGRDLLRITGGLMIGPPDGELIEASRRSAALHGIPIDELTPAEVRARFPGLAPADGMAALLEPRAGILFAETCVEAFLGLARAHGAELLTGVSLLDWEAAGDDVVLHTTAGEHRAARLILAVGPWLPELAAELRLPLEVERQMMHWFRPETAPEHWAPERMPIAIWEPGDGPMFATHPDFGYGVKLAVHHGGRATTPDAVDRTITESEHAHVARLLERYAPGAAGPCVEASVCLYTSTPDSHFLIDFHPRHASVILASPCSGHGFKFASAIGEVLADLATFGRSSFDLTPFRLARFVG